MENGKESTTQSFNAIVGAIILIILLLNIALLLPVSPVRAESEEQTCTGCSQSTETLHYVTVNIVDEEILLQIEPLILPETGCGTCGAGCSSGSEPPNIQSTVLRQDETQTVILLKYVVNGTTLEATMTKTLLWSYNELTDEIKRTTTFVLTEIATGDTSTQFYTLKYQVQNTEYDLTVYTTLTSHNSEIYDSSFTVMNYAPTSKPEVTSLEFVEINSSVTLSQQYAILRKVSKELAKVYENSEHETQAQLAKDYYTMEEEAEYLSKLVQRGLPEYNRATVGVIQGKVVVDSSISFDPQAIQNGGFETGSASYWTIGGYGDHRVTSEDRHSGSYSMLIGYKYSANVANARDYAYQTISLPSYAASVQLSFYYHLYTEDSVSYDWFEAYVRDSSGNNKALVFKKGGVDYPGLEVYGWTQVTYDLSAYAGQTIQIYFAVANMYDTGFKTWVYIDDVSVSYQTCNIPCWITIFLGCETGLPPFELACLAGCAIGALACGPFWPVCVGYCFGICGVIGDAVMLGCMIYAVGYCCLS